MSDKPTHSSDSSSELTKKKVTDNPPDVVLLCEGERISCHREILANASSYFSAMFNSSFAEKDEPVITIHDVNGFMLRILVDLSYGYPLELESDKMMLDLLETASMLQFSEVQSRCVDFLLHSLNASNALQYFEVGHAIGVPQLSKQSLGYVLFHFDNIADSMETFNQLDFELVVKIVDHPNLNCENEVQVLSLINRWIYDQDCTIPEEKVFKLFSCARFSNLNATDLQTISLLPFVQESKLLSKIVSIFILKAMGEVTFKACRCSCHTKDNNDLKFKVEGCDNCRRNNDQIVVELDSESDEDLSSEPKRKRCSTSSRDCRLREFFRYQCCSKKSEQRVEIESENGTACYPPSVLDMVDQLLATPRRVPPFVPCVVAHIRRTESDVPSLKKLKHGDGPSLLMFDWKTKNFQTLARLAKVHEGPVEASGYKVCTLGKDVFIFGGEYMFGYSNWQNSVWRWDSFKNMWNIETSLLSSRRHHSICVYDEFIFLIGGYGKHRIILDTVDRYDTFKYTWKRCAPMPSALYSAACCHYNGLIYVFSHQIFTYDPKSDEWRTLANVRIPNDTTFSHAMSVKNEGIYLTSVYSNFLYYFEPDAESLEVCVVGEFGNNVLNSCYVENLKSIFTFSTAEVNESAGFPPVHQVETFDLDSKTFSILWRQNSSEGLVVDFGIRHSLGCFSALHYE